MSSLKKITLATAALLASTAFVNAADIFIPETEVEVVPEARISTSAGGWYLRGDVGFLKSRTTGVTYYQGTATADGSFEQHDIGSSWMIGGGIGYQATDYLRVDLTANYHLDADFTGSSAAGVTNCGTATGVCDYSDTSELSITTVMANAYIDLGNVSGFTPYVGAGIGGAGVHWGNLNNNEICVSGDCTGSNGDSVHPGRGEMRFAYALHGGVSYDLSANLKVDAGYTFTHIEGGNMFGFEAGNSNTGNQGFDSEIKIHAVKAGLRYNFN